MIASSALRWRVSSMRVRAAEGRAHVLADEGEQLLCLLGVGYPPIVGLHDQGAHRTALSLQRDAKPIDSAVTDRLLDLACAR